MDYYMNSGMTHATYGLAQVLGVYFFVMGASMLLIPNKIRPIMKDFIQSKMLLLFTGYLSTVFGMIIIHMHNIWVKDWTVVITVLGWIILVNGLARIFYMESFASKMKEILSGNKYYWFGWITLIVGGYLGAMGFFI